MLKTEGTKEECEDSDNILDEQEQIENEKVEDEFESQLPPLPTKEDLNISDNASSEPDDLPF